jgi:hypothetical protein
MDDKELISKLKELTKELEERQVQLSQAPTEVEEIYECGDYFNIQGENYIIGATGTYNIITLVSINTGCNWRGDIRVNDWDRITKEELFLKIGPFKKITKKEALQAVLDGIG